MRPPHPLQGTTEVDIRLSCAVNVAQRGLELRRSTEALGGFTGLSEDRQGRSEVIQCLGAH